MQSEKSAQSFCHLTYIDERIAQTVKQNKEILLLLLFSPLGKLAGRAIYFTCVNFFLFLN